MPRVRGTFVLSSIDYVRSRYGPPAHERVMAELPEWCRQAFANRLRYVRDSSWEPLNLALAYMETSKRLLGADDPGFYREMGRFAGLAARVTSFGDMEPGPDAAARIFPVRSRAFIDVGRIEMVVTPEGELRARLFDFPAEPALCERRIGAWEALLSGEAQRAVVEETACINDGAKACQLRVRFEAKPPA